MMFPKESISYKQENAIKELQGRIKNVLTPGMRDDSLLCYRFLKARDFDVDKAEKMLQKHITFRKIHQIDTIVEDFRPKEVFFKCFQPSLIGFDKEGNIVRYSPTGKFSIYEYVKCIKVATFMKDWFWFVENNIAILKAENEKTGRKAYQGVVIFDLDKLTLANAASKLSADLFLHFINDYQDNYPERMKTSIVINAPGYLNVIFSILKTVMSSAMLRKIHVFGKSGWKEKLLEIIDADVLPGFLGGNRTDPDGNPMCNTFVNHEGVIPERYFLFDEDRSFKYKSQTKSIIVYPKEREKISVEVTVLGSLLQWEFLTQDGKDIGFGLFFEKSATDVTEIIPIHRYCTPDGTRDDLHRCKYTGKYIVVFDNSYSWRNSKEVHYCIKLVKPV